ncbi:leucine-rich repeat receptor protein kinase HPCA1-like isoform X1 [Phragmites australis]|uniref:leucine-rich repeat receptor protein kinase HPCA1-like isoform X1 n=2 Tax=Phragmites australis TaxID=29695 RepID=UPI002D79FA7C|nr:leucine-rich repeat receptor protein kinase HPCA1-like isoform X1 [Phragmites australis]
MMRERQQLLMLLFVLSVGGSRIASADTNPQDAAALKSLMKKWTNLPASWGKSNDPCGAKWDGIVCNSNSRVTSLNLFGINMKGTLSDDIGSLTELRVLDLSSNIELGGPLPAAIGKLVKLEYLVLISCSFSGPVPSELGNLSQLIFLALNSNKFTGSIPPSLGKLSRVTWLDLADNQLTGPLPNSRDNGTGLDQLIKAEHFHLNQNTLQGSIPESLFNSSMALKHILFDRNNFSGPIPASVGVLPKLEILRLNNNSFTGQVPALNNLTKLHVLMLSNNKLSGMIPNLTGMTSLENVDISNNNFVSSEVPSWLSDLINIITLTMQSVGLSGQLPQKLFSFPKLQNVVLSDNQLNGTLDMGNNISKELDLVDIQNNKISSVTVYNSIKFQSLKLEGNPLCNNSLLSDTTPCTGKQTEAPPPPLFVDVQCANPFIETIVFRAPSFANVLEYLHQLESNLSRQLSSCTPNRLALVPYSNEDAYLNVDIKACPVNQKKFNYSQILNCFNLTLQSYKPPEKFGPYYVMAHPYPFHDKVSRALLIGIVTGSVLLVVGLTLVGFYAMRQKKRAQRLVSINNPFASWGSMGEDIGEAPKLKSARFFTLEELKLYTNDFREINAIGAGGYGRVYRGKLPDGQLIAIKRSKEGSMQGGLEFKTEIELLSRVHHKNLVGLVGFCFEKGERMLVYEFIPNGTLSEALYGMKGIQLDWSRRLKIALDSAKGLAYLHDHANPPIIHRDVKSTNILLDEKMTAKVADFGLSLLVSDSEEGQLCTNVKGTLGYLDPEYYMTQQLTAKSDVYSFGVVLLELIMAKPPIHENKYIVREVKMVLDMEDGMYCGLKDVMDPVLQKMGGFLGFPRFLKLALQCVQDTAADRPSMNTIVREIEVIMQDNGFTSASMSTSSSFSIESKTMKVAPKYPYSNASTSSTTFDMDSRAFEYSGMFPSSNGSLKNRGT